MCGIVAMVSMGGRVDAGALERATASLTHRGPELRRCWVSSSGRAGLGHARLSIIDLQTGAQPIANEDDSLHLVANGELYDYERLQAELEQSGHTLRTRSDSEVALHLYEEAGAHCLRRLRGEFALALWDERNQRLFAARDRFGIKPLFYTVHEGVLYLASEIKALRAAGVPLAWDEESFYEISHFLTHVGGEEKTLFKGVFQVPPGHYLLASRGTIRLYRYWDFNYPAASQSPGLSSEEYVLGLRESLEEAVRIRLRADVPVGCYLSGGLDSCAVLGIAARQSRNPIQAFTLSFDHADYDERHIAEEMAALAGADFHPISIRQADLAENFADAVTHGETLLFNAHGVAKFLLSRAVRNAGFKVVLTGEGSDEIFAGYPHFRRDMLLYNTQGQDPGEIQRMLRMLEESNRVSSGILMPHGASGDLEGVRGTLGFVPSWLESFASSGAKVRDMLAPDFLARFRHHDLYRFLLDRLDVGTQLPGRDPVHQSLYLWAKLCLPQYVLTMLGDRMEMAHSIEGRVPFLDHHLVERVREMPVPMKIRGLTEKYVLREAAKPFITETVYRRQKHPFFAPPSSLSPGEPLSALVQDTLRGRALGALPFVDQAKVVSLLDRMPDMDEAARTAYDTVLMTLMSAAVLQERMVTAPMSSEVACIA